MEATTIAPPAVSTPKIATPITPSTNTLKTVTPSALPETKGTDPRAARSKMYAELDKKAGVQPPSEQTPKPASAPVPTEEPTTPVEGGEPSVSPDATAKGSPPAGGTPATDTTATPDGKPAKANPWKLYDAEKKAHAESEKQLQELKSQLVPEAERKSYDERITKAEARAKELEDRIRFIDYKKSAEFQEKYQKPYEESVHRAMSELSEITITDSSGVERPTDVKDLLQLVAMPIEQAREIADNVFGKFADDVMAYRKEVKAKLAEQNAALEKVEKEGSEIQKQRQEQFQRQTKEAKETVAKLWNEANDTTVKHEKYGEFFRPKEGDEDWNRRLGKGLEFVEKALAETPFNPKLTAEERKAIVERHAAMKYRAASWSALRHDNEKKSARITELETELGKFKQSIPAPGGTKTETANGVETGSAKSRLFSALDKLSH